MSKADDMCATCGKGGDGLKACNGCKLVKYCDASCQRAHWPKHKKACKQRASELRDRALFKQPPPREDCEICMLPLPTNPKEQKYQPCCGKMLCYGCIHAAYTADRRQLCPFCRTPEHTSAEEALQRTKKRAEDNDYNSICQLGSFYDNGDYGLPQDMKKAIELWLRAGELGCAASYYNVGHAYLNGDGVERDIEKAKLYWELAAMMGDATARHNLGAFESNAANVERAVKHYMISAGAGDDNSLKEIRKAFMDGHATKDDFEKALRSHKESKDEMKSNQRDKAAVFLGEN